MIKNSSKRKICVQSVLLLCVAYSASKRISNEIRAQIQNAIVDTESKVCEYILCFSLLLFFSIAKRDILTKSRISDEFRMFFFYFTETHTHVTSSLHAIRFIIAQNYSSIEVMLKFPKKMIFDNNKQKFYSKFNKQSLTVHSMEQLDEKSLMRKN